MTKPKQIREWIILGILLIVTASVLFFHNRSKTNLATLQSSTTQGQFLPHGTNLDFNLLQDPRFKNLIAPNYPQVSPTEVGLPNPFQK